RVADRGRLAQADRVFRPQDADLVVEEGAPDLLQLALDVVGALQVVRLSHATPPPTDRSAEPRLQKADVAWPLKRVRASRPPRCRPRAADRRSVRRWASAACRAGG